MSEIKVLVNPSDEEKISGGLISTITFDNKEFIFWVEQMFEVQKNEKIIQIDIFDGRMTASFAKKGDE